MTAIFFSDYHNNDAGRQIIIITPGGVAASYTFAGLFYSDDYTETGINSSVGSPQQITFMNYHDSLEKDQQNLHFTFGCAQYSGLPYPESACGIFI